MSGTLTQPGNAHRQIFLDKQKFVRRFNTGRMPSAGEIAATGGELNINVEGFVGGANILQLRVFTEGIDTTDFDIEIFSVNNSDLVPATDQYRQYYWQNINTQDIDAADVPIVVIDEQVLVPVVIDEQVLVPEQLSNRLHARITNNAGGTMHITDLEIVLNEILV